MLDSKYHQVPTKGFSPSILLIGKFQPFHLGHLYVFRTLGSLSNNISIALGSPHEHRYFDFSERFDMILGNTDISPSTVEDLNPDHPLYNEWGRYVLDVVGDIDIVATGNPYVRDDFQSIGKHVLFFSRNDEDKLSGSVIRNLVLSGDESWRNLVPEKTEIIIEASRFYRYSSAHKIRD